MKQVYDTGKVKIGLQYEEPSNYFLDEDASNIQSVLLAGKNEDYRRWYRASNAMLKAGYIAVGCLLVFALFVSNVKF